MQHGSKLRNNCATGLVKNKPKTKTSPELLGRGFLPPSIFFFFFIGVPDSTAKVWGKGFAPRLLTHPADKLRQPSQPLLLTQLCFP